MSILIKGMEMPTSCFYCPMREWYIIHGEKITSCRVAKMLITNEDERPSFCPIVPVPPHGRLIDADALMKHEVFLTCDGGKMPIVYSAYIRYAPTIIEAEEDE